MNPDAYSHSLNMLDLIVGCFYLANSADPDEMISSLSALFAKFLHKGYKLTYFFIHFHLSYIKSQQDHSFHLGHIVLVCVKRSRLFINKNMCDFHRN